MLLSVDTIKIAAVDPPKFLSSEAILEIYMERPVELVTWCCGLWFCMAMQIQDRDLKMMESTDALTYIRNAGYNGLPGLEGRLSSFNEFNRNT